MLNHLAADHDVIVFDSVGTGYTTGEPRDTAEGFADGAVEFIEALGLSQVDLLGRTLGGNVAHTVTLRRPDLVRKLIVAGMDTDMARESTVPSPTPPTSPGSPPTAPTRSSPTTPAARCGPGWPAASPPCIRNWPDGSRWPQIAVAAAGQRR